MSFNLLYQKRRIVNEIFLKQKNIEVITIEGTIKAYGKMEFS